MVAGALLALFAFSSFGATPDGGYVRPRLRAWDVPKAMQVAAPTGDQIAAGYPVEIFAVRSELPIDVLELHLLKQFERANLYIPPIGHISHLTRERMVTGLDPDTYTSYTVFLQVNPDKSTTAIFTETYMKEKKKPGTSSRIGPVMPGGKGLLESRVEGYQLLQYFVAATAEEVWAFHDEAFPKAGFGRTGPGVYSNGQEILSVEVSGAADSPTRKVILTRRRDPAAEIPGPR